MLNKYSINIKMSWKIKKYLIHRQQVSHYLTIRRTRASRPWRPVICNSNPQIFRFLCLPALLLFELPSLPICLSLLLLLQLSCSSCLLIRYSAPILLCPSFPFPPLFLLLLPLYPECLRAVDSVDLILCSRLAKG